MQNDALDIQEIERRGKAIAIIMTKPYWTVQDVSIVLGRCEKYVRILFCKGLIRRDRQNLTRREWVDEYLLKPRAGHRYRSDIGKTTDGVKS